MRKIIIRLSVWLVVMLLGASAAQVTAAPRGYFISDSFDEQISEVRKYDRIKQGQHVLIAAAKASPQKLLEVAKEHSLKGDFAAAQKTYQRMINEFPDSELRDQAIFWLAYVYEENGKPQQAIPLYGQLIKNYPQSKFADDALRKRANIFLAKKDSKNAAQALVNLTKNYPGSSFANEANIELGDLYGYQMDNFAEAVAYYRRHQANDLSQASVEQKIRFFEKNVDFNSLPLKAYCLAKRQSEADKLAEAETTVKELIVEYPKSEVVDDALLLLGQNEVAKAVNILKVTNLFDTETKKKFLNHYKKAARYFQQVIRDFPDEETAAQGQFYIGGIYDWDRLGGLNDFERAKKEYQVVVRMYPGTYWAEKAKLRLESLKRIF